MKNWMRLGLLVGGCALAGFVFDGAAQTKGGKKGPGILQQEWGKVEGGSYSAPMGKLGAKGGRALFTFFAEVDEFIAASEGDAELAPYIGGLKSFKA